MTRPSATCELFLDGVRVPDTGTDLVDAQPTALDGLSLTWGRDGQNEQPGPATCSFTVLDRFAASDFLDRLHVGSTVALWAEGTYTPSGSGYEETYDDPTMQSFPLGNAETSRYASGEWLSDVTVIDVDGARMMAIVPQDVTDTYASIAMVSIPPRRFSPPNELPDAWDDIPVYRSWDPNWYAAIRFKAPLGSTVALQFSFYSGPYESSSSAGGSGPEVAATGDWQTITHKIGHYGGSVDGSWLGLKPFIEGLRPRWKDQIGTWEDAVGAWEESARVLVDTTSVLRPIANAITRRVLAFSGAVTDVVATPFGNGDTLQLDVTAADLGADLGNRVIGDAPWPVQTVAVRANRIAQLAGITSSPRIRIDTPLDVLQVSYRDVDAQDSYALLQDLAQTAGGVLWAATHAVTGAFLWIENPAARAALRELSLSAGLIVIVGTTSGGVTILSACDLLEDPVSWRQDTADVSTVVAVTWLEQGTDEELQVTTTERTETVSDTAAITTYGTRRLSISTELIKQADASNLASRSLAASRAVPWRIEGLTLDTDAGPVDLESVDDGSREIALLNLLDGTTRMGLPITLVDMPTYAPRGSVSDVYIEGGRYAYEQGAWTLSLAATPSSGLGKSAQWGQLDATWKWSQWSPALMWQQLYGVAP